MEKRPSLRNGDKISELPDALLLQILSLLPTEDAVATSVLSKRWRFLCKMMPNLRFNYRATKDLERFSDNVCRCLLSHQAPVLQSLHLHMDFENDLTMDTGIMNIILGVAFGLRVRELQLEFFFCDERLYRFPTSLLNCGTLETLRLDFGVLLVVPFPLCLKNLRTLRLNEVSFEDDGSLVNLLSGCSVLENLEVMLSPHSDADVTTATIAVPSLESLILTSASQVYDYFLTYVINAPSLKYLDITGLREDDSCLIENMPELVEADISGVCGLIYENVHGYLTLVKRLSLEIASPLDLTKLPTDRIFKQLAYLELHTYGPEWWNLFILMLDCSPNLQVLKLCSEDWYREGDQLGCKRWSQPNYVQECLVNRLKTLVWKNYEGEIEDDREVAQYILRNASRLETATFFKFEILPETRLERLKELESVVRASNSCQLVFKDPDDITWES